MDKSKNQSLKMIISHNICLLMKVYGKSRKQVCDDLKIRYTTFTDWCNGNTYPRLESLERLGVYFRIETRDFFSEIEGNTAFVQRLLMYASEYGVSMGEKDSARDKVIFRHKTLEERAKEYGGKLVLDGEFNIGAPVGREVW